MILAGDIGATKTVLALFTGNAGFQDGGIHETRYESNEYDSLENIVAEFLEKTGAKPAAACFGVAGPVNNQESQITNLPWVIRAETIRTRFDIDQVRLLNDLESIATAVPHLSSEDLHTLNEGIPEPHGNMAIVAPGTGLGTAFLVWTGQCYKALASEGGHTSFSPANRLQAELLEFLKKRYSHVSFERICSGGHLVNVYDFFRENRMYPEPPWLREELGNTDDPTPVLIQAGLAKRAAICEATLDMFVHTLGSAVYNMAITILPRGGIYLGGGIPPRILDRLAHPDFMKAFTDKGRFSSLCADMPVRVIMTPRVALYGAASCGLSCLADSRT